MVVDDLDAVDVENDVFRFHIRTFSSHSPNRKPLLFKRLAIARVAQSLKQARHHRQQPPSKGRPAAKVVSPFPEREARREKGEGAQRLRGMSLALSAAGDLLVRQILVRVLLDQRLDDLVVGLVPVAAHVPLLAIPGVDACPGRAHVVGARCLHRTHDLVEAQFLQACFGQVQVFVAPAHLLAGHGLALAELLLRRADGFHRQHRDQHAARVKHGADFVTRAAASLLVVHVLEHVLRHLGVLTKAVERQCLIALGAFAHVTHVRLGTCPPHAIQLVAREAGGLRFLQRSGVHHAPAPQQREVGLALAQLQPGGLLLHAWRGHGQQLQIKAVHLGALLQHGDGFLAERAVVIDQRDLLALELVQAAHLLAQVLDQDVRAGPVAAHEREVPLEGIAILGNRQAIAQCDQRNLVDGSFFCQREGDAGGLRVERGHVGLALQAFVALHAAVGGVAGFALFVRDLHAVDAAIALVDQLEVVLLAVGPWNTVGRIGSGAVRQQRDELLVGLREGAASKTGACGDQRGSQCQTCELHGLSPMKSEWTNVT
ncbi:hypothetical protein SDC9_91467 [bioreactor metagenome]|uniref:Uncharacterized protein n=1 Tax=bioreactor metagenome TaxID=1076179 RepID=A0A644ZV35_9ZZZZ